MSDLVVTAAFIVFVIFFIAGQFRAYAAIAGWGCIVLNLFLELPAFFAAANFLYPTLALLAVPFLWITVQRLLREDEVVLRLSVTAAAATLIFVPFNLVPALRDALIGIVVEYGVLLLTALGHQPVLYAWDVIAKNGFYNQIIPGCTGIMAISLMLGVVAGVPGASLRQRLEAALIIVPTIFILNLFRVIAVFIAVSDRWFASFPDPTGTGDANFFWAHNVVAEALAILFLLALVAVLCRVLPGLYAYACDVAGLYYGDVMAVVKRKPVP